MRPALVAAMLLFTAFASAHEQHATAHYLATEGVVVIRGDSQVAFDPLFRNSFNTYDRVPEALERALVNGEAPFDSIDAVFISHHHGDHFDPAEVLAWLETSPAIELYAPTQAVEAILEVRPVADAVGARITPIDLQPGDEPVVIRSGDLLIEIIRVPHAGWPSRHATVENLVFRVTLDDATTVVHMGDADADEAHFFEQAEHWEARTTNLAMPPFWFFSAPDGKTILEDYVQADHVVGIHAPAEMPDEHDERPERYQGYDMFTEPGETREIR